MKKKLHQNIGTVRKEFEQLRENAENRLDNLDLIDLCNFWKFEKLLLENEYDSEQLDKNLNCDALANADGTMPNWAAEFKKAISQKHYQFFRNKFVIEGGDVKANCRRWFGAKQLANECELSHTFRMVSNGGDIERIQAVKTVLEQCLLGENDASMLYAVFPLETSACKAFA
ncbi:hypothetical protein niasHT_026530 [Heterodera trifolii]|uniref:Uncharacterized protein n=1 Tax=Heterodera trifolii TaxID=157864 RepID=A0ABD2KS27_9BILA